MEKEERQVKEYSSFLCVHCTASFTTPQELEQHILDTHPHMTIHKDIIPTNQMSDKCEAKIVQKQVS